jgi:hypothetical protein
MFGNLQPIAIGNFSGIIQYHFLMQSGFKILNPGGYDFTKKTFPASGTNRYKIQSSPRIIIPSQTDRFSVVNIWIIIIHFLKLSFFTFSQKTEMAGYKPDVAP